MDALSNNYFEDAKMARVTLDYERRVAVNFQVDGEYVHATLVEPPEGFDDPERAIGVRDSEVDGSHIQQILVLPKRIQEGAQVSVEVHNSREELIKRTVAAGLIVGTVTVGSLFARHFIKRH